MFFSKVLIVIVIAFVIISEAQIQGRNKVRNDRKLNGGRNPNSRDRPRRKWGGPKNKFFDNSCKPLNCDGFGFSILVENNATCPTNVTLKEIKSQGVERNEFCEPENSKVCTYCVK